MARSIHQGIPSRRAVYWVPHTPIAKNWASPLKIPLLNSSLNYENPPRSKEAATSPHLSQLGRRAMKLV